MPCPHRAATATTAQARRTALGYRTVRCGRCRRICNERTGTPYNHSQYPTDRVLLVVLWRPRYTLRLRNVAEMFLARGFVSSHEAVRDWAVRFAPLLTAWLRATRSGGGRHEVARGRAVQQGHWPVALPLARDRPRRGSGRGAARRAARHGGGPAVLRAGPRHGRARPRAGDDRWAPCVSPGHPRDAGTRRTAAHRPVQEQAVEQDQRGSKQRYYPMRGCGSFTSAARCCTGCAEQRQYFRPRVRSDERVSLAERRRRFPERYAAVMAALAAA